MEIGLCLSGGGIKGAAHIGAIKALEEENIQFGYVSGTSSGSIVATLYACGFSADEMYQLLKKYGKKIKYIDMKTIFKVIYGLVIKRKLIVDGLNSGEIIEKIVKEACKKKNITKIKDINMPLIIPSVNMKDGSVYLFTSKEVRNTISDKMLYNNEIEIGKAVRASCSYPVVFSPCNYEQIQLIDGGIRENTPWKEIKAMGADRVISIIFENELDKDCCNNIIDIANRSLEILGHELSNYELLGADYIVKMKSENVSLLDVDKMDYLYKIGYKTMKEKMNEIKNVIRKS